ncbi:MAG: FHA domain-containing protein [Planctomycetes bacterium]|nr:FHA domain-containing protein [Planctomycetota bacterium]
MPFIRIKTGPNKGKVFEVKDQPLTIGRDETQNIQVLDEGVSRAHAEIFRIGDMAFVRDLNSTNGTYVNGVSVTEEVLKPMDELRIGHTDLVYEDSLSTTDLGIEYEEGEGTSSTTMLALKTEKGAARGTGREVTSRNLTVTTDVGKILASGKDLGPSLKEAVETVTAALQADNGYLLMVDKVTGKLVPRTSHERGEEGGEKKVSRTIVKRVMQMLTPILTTDATLDQRFMLSESIVLKKIKSVIAAPIVVSDRAEGLLYFHANKLNDHFKVEDLELAAAVALQIALALMSDQAGEKIRRGMVSTIRAVVTAMEIVDPRNQGHSERVADYATAIAVQMGLTREEIHKIRLASLLHDVGKLAVHQSVAGVSKEGMMEQHVFAGERIVAGIEGAEEILPGVRYHHERANGTGFPYKLRNDQTPVMARVIIVANHFDNLCTSGGGGQGLQANDVLVEMAKRGGTDFDDDVIKALIACQRNGTLYSGARLLEE